LVSVLAQAVNVAHYDIAGMPLVSVDFEVVLAVVV
jgi:hypothetical protein